MTADQARAVLLCVRMGKPANLRLYIDALRVCRAYGFRSVVSFLAVAPAFFPRHCDP